MISCVFGSQENTWLWTTPVFAENVKEVKCVKSGGRGERCDFYMAREGACKVGLSV